MIIALANLAIELAQLAKVETLVNVVDAMMDFC